MPALDRAAKGGRDGAWEILVYITGPQLYYMLLTSSLENRGNRHARGRCSDCWQTECRPCGSQVKRGSPLP